LASADVRNQAKQADKRKTAQPETQDDIATLTAGKRYSATSGIEQTPVKKRTWTVGDADDDAVHRGGIKHSKKDRKRGARVKDQASGMNAIPLG
jgi:nucleolar protein 6